MLHPGDRIGDWEIVLPLGQGGMGSVFRCRHALSSRIEAAVKILSATDVPGARERFIREAEALHALRHPAIVRITGFGQDARTELLWLAMELVHGEDFEQLLVRRAFPRDRIADIFGPVAEGLAYAHARGIVHRDLKPANLMLQQDGSPVLLDFGIAVQEGQDRLTQEGMVPGTVAYAAPEQLIAGQGGDPEQADVYALGQVLCECLTGRFTYPRDPGVDPHKRSVQILRKKLKLGPLDPGDEVTPTLRDLVVRATDPDPARRGPPLARWPAILRGQPVEVGDDVTGLVAAPLPPPTDEAPREGVLLDLDLDLDDESSEVVVARSLPPSPSPALATFPPPDATLPEPDDPQPAPDLHEAETEVRGPRRAVWGFVLLGLGLVLVLGGAGIVVTAVGGAAAWWALMPGAPDRGEVPLGEVIAGDEPVPLAPDTDAAGVAAPEPALHGAEATARPRPAPPTGPEGRLVVAADVAARVLLDGRVLRDSPVTHRLPPGRYRVRLDAGGRGSKAFDVLVDPGEVVRRVWSFDDGEWRSFEGGIDEAVVPARPDVVDAQVRVRRSPAVRACLEADPLPEPRAFAFTVAPDGSVVAEGFRDGSAPAEACLKAAVRGLSFGPSKAGAAVTVLVGEAR